MGKIIGKQSPVTKILRYYELTENAISTNTDPLFVKCPDVCQIFFIVIQTTSICNEKDSENWNCGMGQYEDKLTSLSNLTYRIRNPVNDQPIFYDCEVNDRYDSFQGIDYCKKVLNQLYHHSGWMPERFPYKALIEIQKVGGGSDIERFYITKNFMISSEEGSVIDTNNSEITWMIAGLIAVTGFLIISISSFSYICIKRKRKSLLKKKTNQQLTNFLSYSNLNCDLEEPDASTSMSTMQTMLNSGKSILDGDTSKINPNLFLNQQAMHVSYKGKYEIDRSKFTIGMVLGEGHFGNVCEGMAKDVTESGLSIKVAVKTPNNPYDVTQVHSLMCEIKVLSNLENHLNLVNMVGACTTDFQSGKLWLLLEFCHYGNMKSFLLRNKKTLKKSLHHNTSVSNLDAPRLFVKWAHSIAKGMDYLSSKKIMHGDLAARNILIGSLDENNHVAKICDFGLSRTFYDNDKRYKKKERKVPYQWMDIEYFLTGEFTIESDIWSFGVVLWEILSLGREPYAGKEQQQIISEIKAGIRLKCPDEIIKFPSLVRLYEDSTQRCWLSNPELRWRFRDFVNYFEDHLGDDGIKEYEKLEEEYLRMHTIRKPLLNVLDDDSQSLNQTTSQEERNQVDEIGELELKTNTIKEGLAESKKNKATGEDHGGYQFKLEFDNCGVTEVKCDKIEAFHDSDKKFQDDDVSK